MSTQGDYIRPLFPDLDLPDTTKLGVVRYRQVGPQTGEVRNALAHTDLRNYVLEDDDWITVAFGDTTLGDPAFDALIDDPFDGTQLDPMWVVGNGTPTVSGGRLHLPNSPQSSVIVNLTPRLDDLSVETLGWEDAPIGGGLNIKSVTSQYYLQFSRTGGNLWVYGIGTPVSTPFNAVQHACRRIREKDGQVYFEVSPDGQTWTTLRQAATPAWLVTQDVRLQLFAAASTTGEVSLDHARVVPA